MLTERVREMTEMRTRLEGENSDLQRDVDERNKVRSFIPVFVMYMYMCLLIIGQSRCV